MSRRVRTIFIGSGGFGVSSLWWLVDRTEPPVDVVGVITAPARPAGRGGRLTATPIDPPDELGVPTVLRPERLRSPEAIAEVLTLRPELAVLADYGQIVPKPLLDLPYGALNLHPSLLPRHRGASPIQATILAGDMETGVTLMKMDEGLDTGPIVAQERFALSGRETAPWLEHQLGELASDVLLDNLGPWVRGEIEPLPQPEDGATMTRVLRREDGRLDPEATAEVLERQVRAYQPWPGSFVDTPAGRITVWRAGVASATGTSAPGTLVDLGGRLALATVEGLLEFVEAQPAGGKRMSGADLLRGRQQLIGANVIARSASSGQER